MHQTYRVMKPEVVADIIDGEAVIVNLKSGQYFSSHGTGCQCWDALAAGHSVARVVDRLASLYTGDRAAIEAAVEEFVADLSAHMLITPSDVPPPAVIAEAPPPLRPPFEAPVLHVYSDMQDLLVLDPIHDVDDAGWPMPKNEAAI